MGSEVEIMNSTSANICASPWPLHFWTWRKYITCAKLALHTLECSCIFYLSIVPGVLGYWLDGLKQSFAWKTEELSILGIMCVLTRSSGKARDFVKEAFWFPKWLGRRCPSKVYRTCTEHWCHFIVLPHEVHYWMLLRSRNIAWVDNPLSRVWAQWWTVSRSCV